MTLHNSHVLLWILTKKPVNKIIAKQSLQKPPMTPTVQAMVRIWNREHNEWLKSLKAASDCTYKRPVTIGGHSEISCDVCPGKRAGILPIGRCHEISLFATEAS